MAMVMHGYSALRKHLSPCAEVAFARLSVATRSLVEVVLAE
jgi:hypothetical protein